MWLSMCRALRRRGSHPCQLLRCMQVVVAAWRLTLCMLADGQHHVAAAPALPAPTPTLLTCLCRAASWTRCWTTNSPPAACTPLCPPAPARCVRRAAALHAGSGSARSRQLQPSAAITNQCMNAWKQLARARSLVQCQRCWRRRPAWRQVLCLLPLPAGFCVNHSFI